VADDVQASGGGAFVGPDRRAQVALNVRVVPDVPSFAVDDGFAYAVPEGLDAPVGAIVRVPLGGRRVRGWVVGTGEPSKPGLRPILSVSGDVPAFDRALLRWRWAAPGTSPRCPLAAGVTAQRPQERR
jgi:hypothetical protein